MNAIRRAYLKAIIRKRELQSDYFFQRNVREAKQLLAICAILAVLVFVTSSIVTLAVYTMLMLLT